MKPYQADSRVERAARDRPHRAGARSDGEADGETGILVPVVGLGASDVEDHEAEDD